MDIKQRVATVVRTRPGRPDERYNGKLDDRMCKRMAANAVDGKLWRIRPRRKRGVPDETRPSITMGAKDIGSFTVWTWNNDVQNQRVFAVARGHFVIVMTRISDGKVTY